MWCIFKNLKRVCALFIYDHNDIQADGKSSDKGAKGYWVEWYFLKNWEW